MRGGHMHRSWIVGIIALLAAPAAAQDCAEDFDSTFAAIQKVIFENRGCSSVACHDGTTKSGGLDLSPAVAYDNLLDQPATTVPGWNRIVPGQRDRSLLFVNVAARVEPERYDAPLRAMPPDLLAALSEGELEALRLWIEIGAPRDATVPGTAELLDACLPPAKPIEIEPLAPPPSGEGVQLHMPVWTVPKKSETEVCFASYYDVTDHVPEQFRGPNGTFRYKRQQIRQDPLSHHLIVNLYDGTAQPDDAVWGGFTCIGGDKHGEACPPTEVGFCGAGSDCANEARPSIACFAQGNLPGDSGLGVNGGGFTGAQETATTIEYAPGVFNQIPLKGMIIWNSHAFNVTDQDGKLEAWLNFYFAPPEEQIYPLVGIFDSTAIFAMNVPAFRAEEICNIHELPPNAKLFELSSHNHQRGKRWRTFEGAWRCDGGPQNGAACSPYGPDLGLETTDLCAGFTCRAAKPPGGGDCNADLVVTIDELVKSVAIALGTTAASECARADVNQDGAVTVDEIVRGVAAAGAGATDRDPDESLLYTSLVYNDPFVTQYTPPMAFGGTHSVPQERSLTFCQIYDNGFVDPDEVKRRSTSPPTPIGIPGLFGGPCTTPTGCTAGRIGSACSGATPAARNAACDSSPGAGDGLCDACPLLGGVTTEDEMFILMGSYFVAP